MKPNKEEEYPVFFHLIHPAGFSPPDLIISFDNSTRSTRQKFNKSVSLETLSSATLDLAIKVRLRVKSVILIIIMLDLIQ